MSKLKAFRISVDFLAEDGIYWAETASKARYKAKLAAYDSGYLLDFSRLKVKRAPEYDPPKYRPHKTGLSEQHVKHQLSDKPI